MKTILIAIQVALILTSLVLLVVLWARMMRAKASQNELVGALDLKAGETWFRVVLTSPELFAKKWKLLGYQARGVLISSPDSVRLLAKLPSGEKVNRVFAKEGMNLEWIGNTGIGSTNLHWFSLGQGDQQVVLSADTGVNAVASREATADICRIIAPALPLPELAQNDFALEKDPASLTAVVVFFALLAFAFVDGLVLNKHELLGLGRVVWGMPVPALLAIPAYLWMARRRVPSREALTLSILLGSALAGAYVPAIKRVDQLLSKGPVVTAYRLESYAQLQPVVAGPPNINFRRQREYWEQFEEGSTHEFELVHGPLGLWQLDRTRLDPKLREFYKNRDRTDKP